MFGYYELKLIKKVYILFNKKCIVCFFLEIWYPKLGYGNNFRKNMVGRTMAQLTQ
jgi:hypothetical protein